MRVCLVGASGKLGRYMVEQALDRGPDTARGPRAWARRSACLRAYEDDLLVPHEELPTGLLERDPLPRVATLALEE